MKVLVLGGTGTVGSEVARELVRRGVEVDILSRDGAKAKDAPAGTNVLRGDLLDPETVRSAFPGHDGLFIVNGLSTSEAHEGLMALNGARLGDIDRIVYMSVHQADRASFLPHFGGKLAVEEAVLASGIPSTILRPNNFYQNENWFKQAILEYGVYPQPIGRIGIARVDVRDIAEAAAICLTEPGHDEQIYDLVGPRLWNGPDTAALWSEILGREIRYAGEDMDAWEAQNRQWIPAWLAFDFRMMYEFFQRGGLQSTPEEVERATKLLGHPPRGYEKYARETAKAWLG